MLLITIYLTDHLLRNVRHCFDRFTGVAEIYEKERANEGRKTRRVAVGASNIE